MLLTMAQNGQTAKGIMNQYTGKPQGFQVRTDTMPGVYEQEFNDLTNLDVNRNPSESDVNNMARIAGERQAGTVLYKDWLKYRQQIAQQTAQAVTAEHNYMTQMSGLNKTVTLSEHKVAQTLAQHGYEIGNSRAFTGGMANAYQSGMRQGRRAF